MEFQIIDDHGVRIPDAEHELTFELDGPGEILGIENGNISSHEDYKDKIHKAYHGRGLVIIQSKQVPGMIRLTARSDGLKEASVEIKSMN